MNEKLYDSMDWARIEGLVYSEEDNPHEFLGASKTEDGILVQAYIPTAASVSVKVTGSGDEYPMDLEDECGFFAVMLPGRKIPAYTLEVEYDSGSRESLIDPYNFEPQIPQKVLKKFQAGDCWDIYEYLGAHPMTVDGVEGMYFAVWAPDALRVSLVGDFNLWDGRRLPMRKLKEYGIFELFMPGMKTGTLYKYEVKAKHGLTYLKSDPFGFEMEVRPDTASITWDLSGYEWGDDAWMKARAEKDTRTQPMSVYQMSLQNWKVPEEEGKFYSYREIAKDLAAYVSSMGYTAVELFPVTEYSDDSTQGMRPTAYFAPTSRFGKPDDFRFLVDTLHRSGIGVILRWIPTHFGRDLNSLVGFDGTALFEPADPRAANYAPDGGLCFDYGRPQVRNFLISSALFWAKEYHVDGIQMDDISTVLYLDYGKKPGDWVANMYGGNENLAAVDFFRQLNAVFHRESAGAVTIAKDTSEWPRVTGPTDEEGLGFDYKWNKGFRDGLIEYIQLDPIFRGPHHQQLIFSMVYNYSENFMLSLSYENVKEQFGSMYSKVPGRRKNKFANLRACYGYIFLHPGKKLLAEGCDIGQKHALSPESGVDWDELDHEDNSQFQAYMKALLRFYRETPALYAMDYDPDGFEWINNISANENMLVFLRKTEDERQMVLCVVNFSSLVYEDHKIGVPFAGKYKEIFNSDAAAFGGEGNVNPRAKSSKEDECDELPNSIRIKVPPMGIAVFSCTRVDPEKEKAAKEARMKRAKARKSGKAGAGKAGVGKAAAGKAAAMKPAGKKTSQRKPARKSAAAKQVEKAAETVREGARSAAESVREGAFSAAATVRGAAEAAAAVASETVKAGTQAAADAMKREAEAAKGGEAKGTSARKSPASPKKAEKAEELSQTAVKVATNESARRSSDRRIARKKADEDKAAGKKSLKEELEEKVRTEEPKAE